MAKRYSALDNRLIDFIRQQKIFFVATATSDGRVNISPKGMDTLRVTDFYKVYWLNLTGSGNETAAHLLENDRMTLMFCSFSGDPLILRLYGHAHALHPRDDGWDDALAMFPLIPGARQVLVMDIDLVQTSCGMGVPFFDFSGPRDQLIDWADKKGDAGLKAYWTEKNQVSLDSKATCILDKPETFL